MAIKRILVSGFKSIEHIELLDLEAYSVFAGANGAGKSNFFDAIYFVSRILMEGASNTIRSFGGYEHIHCYKRRKQAARTFVFELELEIDGKLWSYFLKIHDMDSDPKLSEHLKEGDKEILSREKGGLPSMREEHQIKIPEYPADRSALFFCFHAPIVHWLMNVEIYRFDPLSAKEPNTSTADATKLGTHGKNVATVLKELEKNSDIRATILEWMEAVVPGLERVAATRHKLDGRTGLVFREKGTIAAFPANLISDGTIYVLCILTAVLSRRGKIGATLIEEPERGINPKVLAQIVDLFRENAGETHLMWVTTHNETIVRESDPRELYFANKIQGRTQFIAARESSDVIGQMPLDKAWLSNLFSGGLPW